MKCCRAASTKKTAFLAQKMAKNASFWPKTVFVGPEWLNVGRWTQRNVFCQVLVQVVECFGAAITKKTPFFAKKWPKKAIFWPETVFLGPEWAVVGPPTLF